jgi:hypothetical protein
VAASAALEPVLLGAAREVRVAAVTPSAAYLATGDPALPALCLCTPAAVRVPCALVLGTALPRLAVGDTGSAGAGLVTLDGFTARVARWWRPARPRFLGGVPTGLPDVEFPERIEECLGLGEGLTPFWDDVIAGALVTLNLTDPPRAQRLAEVVDALAPRRTTLVSAALLRHAGRGECVPELAALIEGAPGALPALLRVGHSSGAGLAAGVHAALEMGRAPAWA